MEVALAYCEEQRSIAVRWQQTAEAMAQACEQERGRREAAEDRIEELEGALEVARHELAQRVLQIEELQESAATLELRAGWSRDDSRVRTMRSIGFDMRTVAMTMPVRRRVLKQQVLRARLGKTDMSPWSRMQTLQQADNAGIELSGDQFEELMDLQLRYG